MIAVLIICLISSTQSFPMLNNSLLDNFLKSSDYVKTISNLSNLTKLTPQDMSVIVTHELAKQTFLNLESFINESQDLLEFGRILKNVNDDANYTDANYTDLTASSIKARDQNRLILNDIFSVIVGTLIFAISSWVATMFYTYKIFRIVEKNCRRSKITRDKY